jgi:5-methylcytosine-specific restriction protein A
MERFEGKCARCSRPAESIQHRKPRQMGGRPDPAINNLSNLVALCGELGTVGCHGEVESNRTQAYADGYLVKDALPPRLQPMLLWDGRRVLLDDVGGWSLAEDAQRDDQDGS